MKASKCQWAKETVQYLGHKIGGGKVRPLEARVEAIKNFIRPSTKTQLRSFLEMAGYYRKYIRNFAETTAVLSDGTKKQSPDKLGLTDEMEKAFDAVKSVLTSDTLLKCPDENAPFMLQTDASGRGIEAVLNQMDEKGNLCPTAFYSRKLKDRERNYAGTQLAIVEAVKHKFAIHTDSKDLLQLEQYKEGNPRLMRWALSLQLYHRAQARNR